MKNKIVSSVIYLVYGVLLAAGPHTLFAVCEQGENMMRCGWTARVETAIGIFVVYLAVLNFLSKEKNSHFWLGLSFIGASVLAIVIPAFVVGGCKMAGMQCRAVTFPVIYVLSGLVLVFSLGNILFKKK